MCGNVPAQAILFSCLVVVLEAVFLSLVNGATEELCSRVLLRSVRLVPELACDWDHYVGSGVLMLICTVHSNILHCPCITSTSG